MPSRVVLIVVLASLIALPGLAVGLNRLARWTINQAIQTQQQLDRFESSRQHGSAELPGD
jgi:Tfp pilus assembly protein PilN